MSRLDQHWARSSDWPLAPAPDPADWPSFPFETVSESGLRFLLDKDWFGERCDFRTVESYMSCILPPGHDGPHIPQAVENEVRVGRMVIRSMWRTHETLPGLPG